MGKLNKVVIRQYIENECDRQLFINLAEGSDDWLSVNRPIKPLTSIKRGPPGLSKKIGIEYEKRVYSALRLLQETTCSLTPQGEVARKSFKKEDLEKLKLNPGQKILFLEHGIRIPEKFIRYIIDISQDMDIPLDLDEPLIYPDLLLMEKGRAGKALLHDGTIVEYTEKDSKNRVAINIFDIKKTPEDNVNKKQFIEIAYYGFAISQFLRINKLDSIYYVNVDGNGIFPGVEELRIFSLDQLLDQVVLMEWIDIQRLLMKTFRKIRDLWNLTKCNFEEVETNISTKCGRCNYYDDCMDTEGINGSPGDMSIKLLPYTSMSTAEQLKLENINTVGDLVNKIDDIPILNTPRPIYTELPLLKLKGNALYKGKTEFPDPGDHLSMAIPKYDNISITINFEEDPLNTLTFGFSLVLNIHISPGAPFHREYEKWMDIWNDFTEEEMELSELFDRFEYDLESGPNTRELQTLRKVIKFFNNEGANYRYHGESYTTKNGDEKTQAGTWMQFEYALVNESDTPNAEYEFLSVVIFVMYNVIRYASLMEKYIFAVTRIEDKEYYSYPITAIYYWSHEIVEIFERLLQRHFRSLLMDDNLNSEVNYMINWATPSESMVKNEVQLRKIFDVRKFVETTQGLPYLINYTWHGIYEDMTGYKPHEQYYSPHFNYMDHNNWYQFLDAKETSSATLLGKLSKSDRREKIKEQLLFKARAINFIRRNNQRNARSVISNKNRKPAQNVDLNISKVPRSFHDIAKIWYMYSKLNGAHSEIAAAEFRHYYPQYSIGKLAAGKVDNLRVKETIGSRDGRIFSYSFDLMGLSSNMKISEGDVVLLLPHEERDLIGDHRKWEISIDSIFWDEQNEMLSLTTVPKGATRSIIELYKEKYEKQWHETVWYVYHKGEEYWSSKLMNLLGMSNLGGSWLGFRLAYLWGISSNPLKMEDQDFTAPELYLYYPHLVNQLAYNVDTSLLTTVKFPPNPSQKNAILNSLRNVISSIQGPPGTGKSQTIVALIDEFILRFGHAPKILVTAFSYQALHVLIDKISESTEATGSPTRVASMERIYLRSESRVPYRGTRDLMRKGKATWRLDNQTRMFGKRAKMQLPDYFQEGFIMFGVAHQLYRLNERKADGYNPLIPDDFAFDLIIVDEASQMPVDQILASLVQIHEINALLRVEEEGELSSVEELHHLPIKLEHPHELTKLILVGDNYQLPPVQPVPPPENLKNVLGSLFSYYIVYHKIPNVQLEVNYRSHEIIVAFTSELGFYRNLTANVTNATDLLPGDISRVNGIVKQMLIPERVMGVLIHDHRFETAVSALEASIVVDLILSYFNMRNPRGKAEQLQFFREEIGVVSPHNAHGRMIIRRLHDAFNNLELLELDDNELVNSLKQTIFSVEKFQGSDRNLIIASMGISSIDQLTSEEEFIYEINRFNVLSSRAKNKMIMICSRNFLEFFPNNREVMKHASKIQRFAFDFCNKSINLDVSCSEHNDVESLEFRYRDQLYLD